MKTSSQYWQDIERAVVDLEAANGELGRVVRDRRAKGAALADIAAADPEYIAALGQLRSAADRVHTARIGYDEARAAGR